MAVNAHLVIQTILLLAMAGTAAYCWIKVLFPPARLDSWRTQSAGNWSQLKPEQRQANPADHEKRYCRRSDCYHRD